MKFIVDANLSPDIVEWLRSIGHDAHHVDDLHEIGAEDDWIWHEALKRGASIITKDGDFSDWVASRDPAPIIIWLRTGNLRKRHQMQHVQRVWLKVLTQVTEGRPIIEVH